MKLFESIANIFKKQMTTPYEGAARGPRTQKWQTTSANINSLLASNLDELRRRSRDMVRNNAYAANAVESIVANCIGTGIKPQSIAKDDTFRKSIQELWLKWTDEADFDNLTDFYGLQALILKSVIEGGECFVRIIKNKNRFQLQVLESEYLDSSKDMQFGKGNKIINGIEFDKYGRRVAYYLFKEHPGSTNLQALDSVKVDAKEILHIYKPIRPGQIRGEPWIANVLLKLRELDQYEDAELVRKKTSAMFAAFVTRMDPDSKLFNEEDFEGKGLSGLEPGTLQYLDPGEDVKFSAPADVGNTYEAFLKQQLRAVAIGMGITYEQLTGDLSNVNYSSIRAGLVEFRRRIAMLQHHVIVYQFCRPVWLEFIKFMILSGSIKVPKDSSYTDVKWIPQGFSWVDPQKEQEAQKEAVRCGFKSRAEVVSELGYDIEEVDVEIASDMKRAHKLGLHFDTDTHANANINSQQTEEAEEDDKF